MKLKKCKVGMRVVFNNFGPLVISCINRRTVNLRFGYICLLASVHTAWLAALPPSLTEQISKDLDAYLSFALGDGWPDENSPES